MNLLDLLFPPKKDDTESPHSRFDSDEAQAYFKDPSVNSYIKKLLRCEGKDYLTNGDMEKLKEAYEKAHDIRKFEIDLYWKRTTYIWTLVAALITICGVAVTALYRLKDDPEKMASLLIGTDAIAIFGSVITIISSKILISGEYWQKNWEFHVNILEPFFSGSLYSTHLYNNKSKRYSIATLNKSFYLAVQCIWFILIIANTVILLKTVDILVAWLSAIIIVVTLMGFSEFIAWLTQSEDKNTQLIMSQSSTTISTMTLVIDNRQSPEESGFKKPLLNNSSILKAFLLVGIIFFIIGSIALLKTIV
ncbi:hypothetical protein C1N60_11810 [Pantoea sp. SGAir0184]